MELNLLRNKIDEIDTELVKLFAERMSCSAEIAQYKKENNLPIFDRNREDEIINKITENSPQNLAEYIKTLYQTIFDVSRSYQQGFLDKENSQADCYTED